ncbi:MAG: hypothetical protein WCR42_15625 [bacterium]
MKIKYLILVFLIIAVLSCNEKEELLVKDIPGNDVNILESKKEKIIVISNGLVCHDCVINLDEYIAKNYNIANYEYDILYEDPKTIPGRRWTADNYKNEFTRNVQKIYFCSEDENIQQMLNIPDNLFKQLTPYVIYIGKDNKPIYKSFEVIFNNDRSGTVKKSFRIK